MHVFQVHTRYRDPGGEDAVVAAEAELLRAGGHEVSQWIGRNPDDAVSATRALLKAPANKAVAAEVGAAAAEANPDVVHVHNTWFSTSPAAFAALRDATDAPIVMTLHNYRLMCANALLLRDGSPCEICVGRGPWSAVRYGCYRDSRLQSVPAAATISINRRRRTWTDNVDRFLALTEFARQKAVDGGLPADKVVVKPNFVPDPGPRQIPPGESDYVLFVGRLAAEKGVATLIAAWRKSPPPGLRLVVAGDGPLLDELRSVGSDSIQFLGRVGRDDVQRLMLGARSLVFPSEWYEGMPMTLLESFAAGLPVLGSRIGSVTEIVEPLGADWLVTPGDATDWSTAIGAIADSSAADAAGGEARGLWEAYYAPSKALDNLVAAYRA